MRKCVHFLFQSEKRTTINGVKCEKWKEKKKIVACCCVSIQLKIDLQCFHLAFAINLWVKTCDFCNRNHIKEIKAWKWYERSTEKTFHTHEIFNVSEEPIQFPQIQGSLSLFL